MRAELIEDFGLTSFKTCSRVQGTLETAATRRARRIRHTVLKKTARIVAKRLQTVGANPLAPPRQTNGRRGKRQT